MLRERFDSAVTLDQFTDQAKANQELWRAIRKRAQAPVDLVERLRSLPARRYLLVLTEDWCGDAVNTLPPVARLAEAVPQLELRILPRDENLDLMDTHLTGTARAIPVMRRWYARDHGRTALEEITQLLERTARSDLQKLRTCAIQSS